MNAKHVFIAIFGLVLTAVIACVWSFLSAALYYAFIHEMPQSLGLTTAYDLWKAFESEPVLREPLIKGMGLSGAGMAVLALFGAIAATSKKRELHGSARFANGAEIRAAGLDSDKGILIGQEGGRYLSFGGQQFVWLAAPTRSGKGVGVVIPNLLNWPDSAVVLDIKGENYQTTSLFRQKNGQDVFVFNPFDKGFTTHRWNPLAEVSRDPNFTIGELLGIAGSLYPTEGVKDAFWQEQAQNLFLGLSLYLIETEKYYPKRYCSMGEIYRQSGGYGKPLQEHVRGILKADVDKISNSCAGALNRFCTAPENTLGNIKSTFDSPLLIFTNPITDAATSTSDFYFRDLRKKRMTLYLVIPPKTLAMSGTARLLNLFFSQLLAQNLDDLPNATLKYQCLLVLDEFTSIGKIAVLAKAVSFLAGYNIRLLPIIQSMSQLIGVYGKDDAKNISTNHAVQVVFPPRELSDADEVSKTLGTFTEKAVSTGRSGQGMFSKGGISRSENQSDQPRALMMPQELREMPQTDCIVLMENTKPIVAKKIQFYRDHVFMDRLKSVSPKLKAFGKKFPNHHQLSSIVDSGDLSSFVKKLDMEYHLNFIAQRMRDATEEDVDAIASGLIKLVDDGIPEYVEGMEIDVIMDAYLNARIEL